ncbi:MAG: cysteine synthase A [Bdellovibrionia bacterium]
MRTGEIWNLVAETPLVKIPSLSEKTGCEIYAKVEYVNPGASIKDRAAKQIILDAEFSGKLKKGMTIYEGTAGNTGIGLATFAIPRGYKVVITMPSNQAPEKFKMLEALGAKVIAVAPCPFANPVHFYHQARTFSEADPQGFWANQFENLSNFRAHYETTGPEIWQQTQGAIDVFVCASGTGGTIGGVSRYLKEKNSKIEVHLVDPMGSGLYQYLKSGEIKTEGSSVTEGIGIMRLTENFKQAIIDDALRVDDNEMITMLYHLAQHDGLFVGTSAALNVAAAYKLALRKPGQKIVTILCDHGSRYQERILSPNWLNEKGLSVRSLF